MHLAVHAGANRRRRPAGAALPSAELSSWIDEHHLKHPEAAGILVVSRPQVSDVVHTRWP
jgi:hypothetical protein